MSKMKNNNRLTVKDLITGGVFAALLLIANAIGGGFFAANPALTFYYPVAGAILGGPIFMLLIAKVEKRGILSIIGVIFAILALVTGMHWGMAVGGLIGLIIADVLVSVGKYQNPVLNVIAYMVYSIGPAGTYFIYFADPASWNATMLENGTSQEYIDIMSSKANTSMLIIMVLGTFVVAAISGMVGNVLLKKQFKKAGVTA